MGLPVLARKVKKLASFQLLNLKALINGESPARGFSKFKKTYKLRGELGRGGFGIVYRATRLSDDMPVAVKFIDRRQVKEWGKLNDEQVPTEVCMLARCSKISGCIKLLDWYSMPEGYLIVMERPYPCMDLFDLIKAHQRLDEDVVAFLMRQIIETIHACAERRVLHRDIKDENIVVDLVTGETKLIDFGAATMLKKSHYTDFQGTRLYCPPEWFLHSLYLGREAAVWSLGVLMYNALNGRLPFRNEKDICTAHLLGPLPFYAAVSSEARELISRCLTFDPFCRCTIEELLSHPWVQKERPAWQTLTDNFGTLPTIANTPEKAGADHSEELEELHSSEGEEENAENKAEEATRDKDEGRESGVGSSRSIDENIQPLQPLSGAVLNSLRSNNRAAAKTSLLLPPSSAQLKEVVQPSKTKSTQQTGAAAVALRPTRVRRVAVAVVTSQKKPSTCGNPSPASTDGAVLAAFRTALSRERVRRLNEACTKV